MLCTTLSYTVVPSSQAWRWSQGLGRGQSGRRGGPAAAGQVPGLKEQVPRMRTPRRAIGGKRKAVGRKGPGRRPGTSNPSTSLRAGVQWGAKADHGQRTTDHGPPALVGDQRSEVSESDAPTGNERWARPAASVRGGVRPATAPRWAGGAGSDWRRCASPDPGRACSGPWHRSCRCRG